MSNELTNEITPDTDNLDDFENLFFNKKEVKETPKEVEEVREVSEEDHEEDDDLAQDDTESDDSDQDEDPKPETEKKKNRFQERIDQLVAKNRDAERKLAEANERLVQQNKTVEVPVAPIPVVATVDDGPKPDMKNADGSDKYPLGEFDSNYIRDFTRHIVNKEQEDIRQRTEQEQLKQVQAQQRQDLQNQWNSKVSSVTEKYEDFFDKANNLEDTFKDLDPQYSEYLATTIKLMDAGPDVLYYLSNNLEEAKKFVNLGPLQATLALGRYEAMFSNTETKPTKEPKTTKAPVPPQLNKGSKASTSIPDDTDDLDAFERKFFALKKR